MIPSIWYVAHPVSGDIKRNIANAKAWLRWLVDHEPGVALCMPWLPYLDVLDDDNAEHRARGLRDACAMAASCSGIVLCGGRISSGMHDEIAAYKLRRGLIADLGIADLTEIGAGLPPAYGDWPSDVSPLAEGRKRWARRISEGAPR